MKYFQRLIAGLSLGLIFLGCKQEKKEQSDSPQADTVSVNGVSSLAALKNSHDSTRKFIRTADLKFKVSYVIQTTYAIEDLVNRQQGFIAQTNLSSTTSNFDAIALGEDSLLESSSVLTTNTMTIRIPDFRLDTLLKEIAAQVEFLDYRVIQSEDVSLALLTEKLVQQRAEKTVARLGKTIDPDTGNPGEKITAEEVYQNKLAQSDYALINSLALTDKVNFSTVHLTVYQREAVLFERVSNNNIFKKYEPTFGRECMGALNAGLIFLQAVTIFLLRLWGLFLFITLGFIVYKKILPGLRGLR